MAPVMIMMMAMGLEVTYWSVNKVELQRIADVAAWAGAREYTASNSAQTATSTAADMAEVNGITGTASRTWNATTETMTDSQITAQVVAGVKPTSDTAVQVAVQRSIATSFSAIFPGTPAAKTVSAIATAEIVGATPLGPQPCLLASDSAVQNAFSQLTTQTTQITQTSKTCSSSTISPGTYASIGFGIPVSMTPGTYIVTNGFSLQGGTTTKGSGVTIVVGGQVNIQNGATFDVSAPTSNASAGIRGMLPMGNSSTQSLQVAGGSSLTMSGVLYFPDGLVSFSNGSSSGGSGCLELIAGSVLTAGGASLGANCGNYGTQNFGSLPSSSTITLVE